MKQELNEKIKKIVEKSPCSYSTIIQHSEKYSDLLKYIMEETSALGDLPFSARVYFTLNDIKEYMKCKVCGKDIPHARKCNALSGYASLCCSPSCAQLDPDYKKAVEQRNMLKYGVKRPQMSEDARRRASEKALSRSRLEQEKINEKRKTTCLKKYGTDSVSRLEGRKTSITETWKSKTKKELSEIDMKRRESKLKKYGDEFFVNPEKTKNTIKKNIESDPGFYDESNTKRKNTCLERYGVQYGVNTVAARENRRRAVYSKQFDETISKNEKCIPLFSKEEFIENPKAGLKWKCLECGKTFEQHLFENQLSPARCMECHPLNEPASKAQSDILNYIRKIYNGNICVNDRKAIHPNELDIYLPDMSMAFEFDGLYWHSENDKINSKYHICKTEKCEKNGIRLIHIFENEWLDKQDIVKSRIANILGVYEKTIFARKCRIHEVDSETARLFQNETHIQGAVNSKIRVGLFYEDKLVALMTFGRCRFDKAHEWEMLRFCAGRGMHIPGAAGKLLKYFEKTYKPKSLVSYADRRWSQGLVYKKLGFTALRISKPDYWYWKYENGSAKLFSRLKFQKHKLEKTLDKFDPRKSEVQNMLENGYRRIFDCGNYVFEKIY